MKPIITGMALLATIGVANAQTFEDLARSPDGLKGRSIYITGKVIQSQQNGNQYAFRINVTREPWGWKDTVLVYYKEKTPADRIIEGDIVDVSGRSAGIASYKAVMGQTVQLPSIAACKVTPHTGGKWVSIGGDCD